MSEPGDGKRPLVLLAEDDRDSREMYALALELAGFRTAQAENGAEALNQVARLSPDVIVTDLNLPGVDGYELCARLKGDPRTQGVPVLALTGRSLATDVERARQAGCVRVLVKPFAPDELGPEIRKVLTSSGARE
jgi:CheY-like chemotaxis protein